MTTEPAPLTAAGRLTWMDGLRGLAILAVVYYHSVLASEWNQSGLPSAFVVLNDALGPFRIPLLIFLSGMLLGKSLAKPAPQFFAGKARRILWPYLIWTTVVLGLLGELQTLKDALLILLPVTHMWFLWALLWFYSAGFALRRAPTGVWLISAVAAAALSAVAPFERVLYLWPFFVLGYLYASRPNVLRSAGKRGVRMLLLMAGSAALVASALGWQIQYEAAHMPAVLAGVLVVARPFHLPERWRLTRVITYVGRNSLIFYAVHWPAIGLLAMGMGALGWDNPTLVLFTAIVVGIGSGGLFAAGANKYRVINALFVFPKFSRKRRAMPDDSRNTIGSAAEQYKQ